MPPCPSGSHIKPSLAALQWVLPEALCLATAGIPVWGAWLSTACSLMSPQLVRVDELCTSGPPPYPEIDIVKLAEQGQAYVWQRNLSAFVWAAWVNANWAILCECLPVTSSGSCPPVAPFGGGNITQAPGSVYQVMGTAPIGHNFDTMTMKHVTSASNTEEVRCLAGLEDASHTVMATAESVIGPNNFENFQFYSGNTTATQRANARFLRFSAQNRWSSGITQHATLQVVSYTGSCVQDTTVTPPPPSPTTPPTAPGGDPPPPLPAGTCTTDQLCKLLTQVLQQGVRNGQLLELLQRYAQPFGYRTSLVHGPYTGASSFAVSNLLGVQVDLQPPLPGRQLEGTPPYVWDAGWMSVMTADGMIEERRITRDTQIWQPRLMSEATTFGYYLKSGVSASFTELIPDPNGPAILLPPGTT